MNYLIIFFVGVAGFILGRHFSQKRNLISRQAEQKAENKKRVLGFLKDSEKITNNNVENLLGVSNATAERYLNELEKEGKLTQHGNTGKSVFYTLK